MNKGKIVKFKPNSSTYYKIGLKLYEKGEVDKAIEKLNTASNLDRNNSEIRFNLAGLLAQQGKFEESNKILNEIIENNPKFYDSLFGLGCNYFEMGKHSKAKTYLKRYIQISHNKEFSEAAKEIVEFIDMQKLALKEQKRIEKLSNLLDKGNKELEKGRFEDAIKYFEMVLMLDNKVLPARNNLSLAYFYIGEVDKALKLIKEVLQESPFNTYANCNLAVYYKTLNMEKEFKEQLSFLKNIEAIEIKDKIKLLDTYIKLNDHDSVSKVSEELFQLTDDPLFMHIKAISYYNMKKYIKAKKIWDNLINENKLEGVNIEYFLNKVRNTLNTFKKDKIDYFETGFDFENEIPDELKIKIDREISELLNDIYSDNYKLALEVIENHYKLTPKQREKVLALLEKFPIDYPGITTKGFAAAMLYIYLNNFGNNRVSQKEIASLFKISSSTISKWVNELKVILIKE